jgi:hypothetical protein
MSAISVGSNQERLTKTWLKDDGTRAELQGKHALTFQGELRCKILANRTIDMLKLFPGFCEWWFQMDEDRRSFIFSDLQMTILRTFAQQTGLLEQRAEQVRDVVVEYFDNMPGFTNWTKETAGADLRGRVHYQLKDHLWQEMRT